jgi:hypothetical protein
MTEENMPESPPPPPGGGITLEERQERLSRIVAAKTMEGYVVIDRNEREVTAILSLPPRPTNHVLHAIITFFTCLLWSPIWLLLSIFQRREHRLMVSIDSFGNYLETKAKLQ